MIRPPVEIWLPQGSFKVNASRPGYRAVELPVAIDDRSRRSLVVELRPVNEPPIKPKAKTIEIEADPTQPGVVGTPKKIKHKSLLRAKWTRNVIRHREETAQHSSVSVRMLAGPALSAHSGSTPRSRSSTFGLQFRADGRYALSRRLAIGTGLSLLWAGEDSEGAQRSTQVAVPIALSAALLRGNHWRVEIESGFAARFGVAGRVGSDDIAAFDLAPSLGVSLRVKRFVVELHGEWGLLDIERGSGTSRRRSLAFLLGTEF